MQQKSIAFDLNFITYAIQVLKAFLFMTVLQMFKYELFICTNLTDLSIPDSMVNLEHTIFELTAWYDTWYAEKTSVLFTWGRQHILN